MANKEDVRYNNSPDSPVLYKSNLLIGAKQGATLKENKILALGLTRVCEKMITEDDGSKHKALVAELYPSEIHAIIGGDKNSIYTELKTIAAMMQSRSFIEEDGNGNFELAVLVPRARYKDGVFTIFFETSKKAQLMDFKGNFTTLSLMTLTNVDKNSSFRIYEVLKKEMYRSDPHINEGRVTITYSLAEFRFLIGLASPDEEMVKKKINEAKAKGIPVDWEYLYDHVAKVKKYDRYTKLRSEILEPAEKELAEKSDIRFSFEPLTRKGKKVTDIRFTVWKNDINSVTCNEHYQAVKSFQDKDEEEFKQTEYPEIQYPSLYNDYVGHNYLTVHELNLFLQDANYDEALVRKCIDAADQAKQVNNYIGWIRHAIKNGIDEPREVEYGSIESAEQTQVVEQYTSLTSVQDAAWRRIKQQDSFEQFIVSTGLTVELFEELFDVKERCSQYAEWRTQNIANERD